MQKIQHYGIDHYIQASRMYATSYMRVLIRAKVPDFVSWGISLLITQLYDTSSSIAMEALNIMNEACDEYVSVLSMSIFSCLQGCRYTI